MSKEINGLLNLYFEVDENILIEDEEKSILRNKITNQENNYTNLVYDFLNELLENNKELIKEYGFKEINFQIHETNIEKID